MAKKILFIVEGERTEQRVLDHLVLKHFFLKEEIIPVVAPLKNYVYFLFNKLKSDDYQWVDLLDGMIEITQAEIERFEKKQTERKLQDTEQEEYQKQKQLLETIKNNEFPEVYLFFDLDAHEKQYSHEKIEAMLAHFNNETENGLLLLSYPMVEAAWHYCDGENFLKKTVPIHSKEQHYKSLVNKSSSKQMLNMKAITKDTIGKVFAQHIYKADYICHQQQRTLFTLDSPKLRDQQEIFAAQLEQYIQKNDEVAVLSAFPLFISHYFGINGALARLTPPHEALS